MEVQKRFENEETALIRGLHANLAEEVSLGADTEISLPVKDGELGLKASEPSGFRLVDLLAGVVPENNHAPVDTGNAVGPKNSDAAVRI